MGGEWGKLTGGVGLRRDTALNGVEAMIWASHLVDTFPRLAPGRRAVPAEFGRYILEKIGRREVRGAGKFLLAGNLESGEGENFCWRAS